MHDPCDKPFQLILCCDLDLGLTSRSKLLLGGGPQFSEFACCEITILMFLQCLTNIFCCRTIAKNGGKPPLTYQRLQTVLSQMGPPPKHVPPPEGLYDIIYRKKSSSIGEHFIFLIFMPPARKVRQGHLVIGSSVRPSVRKSVMLTNKVQYLKFGWSYSNQTWTVSSSEGCSHFTYISCPGGWGRGQNEGLRDFCHILTLLPPGASVLCNHMSSCKDDYLGNMYKTL